MTLTEHLAELRSRIIRSLLAVVIGIIVILAFYDQVLDFLRRPVQRAVQADKPASCTCDLQFIGPLEGFTTRLSICTYGGIILALPVILWQIWRFIVPALHEGEAVRDPVHLLARCCCSCSARPSPTSRSTRRSTS